MQRSASIRYSELGNYSLYLMEGEQRLRQRHSQHLSPEAGSQGSLLIVTNEVMKYDRHDDVNEA